MTNQASERADQWGAMVAPLAEVEVTVVHTQPSSAGDIGLRTEQDVVKKYSSCLNTVLHTAFAGEFSNFDCENVTNYIGRNELERAYNLA